MSRELVLGNGRILLNFDGWGRLRDLYFPHVGLENQIGGHFAHRIGVFVDGVLSWTDAPNWRIRITTEPNAFAGKTETLNDNLGIQLVFFDTVYNEKNIFLRRVTVKNLKDRPRQIKLFFYQQFEPYESHIAHTAYFDPAAYAIIHYRNQRIFLISGQLEGRKFDDFSTGVFSRAGLEGTYRDAEDGQLAKNPIEHGPADSAIGFTGDYAPLEEKTAYYWLALGESFSEVMALNNYVLEKGAAHLQETTRNFWQAWVNRRNFSFHGLSQGVVDLFKQSLFLIRAHVDWDGGIIASGDPDSLQHGKDTYAYVWPRDGAFAAWALTLSGDWQPARSFFSFCNQVLSPGGYFMHKYSPDKSLGSSWHPFVKDGKPQLPIQEDETALVLWALWEYYVLSKDLEFIETVYNPLIVKAADFMVLFRDAVTGLPSASYDLWEEKFGMSTFTAAAVFGALEAASCFANLLGKVKHRATYHKTAEDIKTAILRYLYDEKEGYFYKMVNLTEHELSVDTTLDLSSVLGLLRFSVFPPDDERLRRAFDKTSEVLRVASPVGGLARYQNDSYYRSEPMSPGNPWIITTLWQAQRLISLAKSENDLAPAKGLLEWACRQAKPSGILPEQLHPTTGEHLSVSPLCWSHAEFVITVIKYLDKLEELGICQACNPVA